MKPHKSMILISGVNFPSNSNQVTYLLYHCLSLAFLRNGNSLVVFSGIKPKGARSCGFLSQNNRICAIWCEPTLGLLKHIESAPLCAQLHVFVKTRDKNISWLNLRSYCYQNLNAERRQCIDQETIHHSHQWANCRILTHSLALLLKSSYFQSIDRHVQPSPPIQVTSSPHFLSCISLPAFLENGRIKEIMKSIPQLE